MARVKKTRLYRFTFCDFCGAGASECAVLIQGRDLVHICNQCVQTCAEMLITDAAKNKPVIAESAQTPEEG